MDKAVGAYRTISEVGEELDIPQHVLRFWETRFPQIKPMKRSGGRRYYRPADVLLLKGIRRLLYGEGYTIKGVQRILATQGAGVVQRAGGASGEELAGLAEIEPASGLADAAERAAGPLEEDAEMRSEADPEPLPAPRTGAAPESRAREKAALIPRSFFRSRSASSLGAAASTPGACPRSIDACYKSLSTTLANAPDFSIPSAKKKRCRGRRRTRLELLPRRASDAEPRFRPGASQ